MRIAIIGALLAIVTVEGTKSPFVLRKADPSDVEEVS
jgi:hypothetical protein